MFDPGSPRATGTGPGDRRVVGPGRLARSVEVDGPSRGGGRLPQDRDGLEPTAMESEGAAAWLDGTTHPGVRRSER